MGKAKQYRLELGMQVDVSISVFGRSIALSYTGQVHEYVFSLALIQTKGYNSYAYNIYFNADQKEIRLLNGHIRIVEVDAQHIEFIFQKD